MEKKNHGIAAIPHLRVRFFGAEGAEKADLELGVLPSVFCDNINDLCYLAKSGKLVRLLGAFVTGIFLTFRLAEK